MRDGPRTASGPLVAAALALVLGACSPAASPSVVPSTGPASAPASAPATGAAAASPGPTASPSLAAPSAASPAGGSPSASSSPAGEVMLDETLLAILPPEVDGFPVTAETQAFAEAAADPAFRRNVARAVFPIVVSGDDLASGVIAQLVPGRYTDELFRDWRDTYNEGVCAQAGGVTGSAEAEIGGRTVYIGSCAGGVRVYHAAIEERTIIVSLFSIGQGRLGERLIRDVRP